MSTADIHSAARTELVTAEQLLQDYRGQRCELVEGKVKQMSPSGSEHGLLAVELAARLSQYVKTNGLGRCFGAETGFVVTRNPDTVLAPDVAFVRQDRIEAIGITEKYFPEPPTLAVEIVSPSDTAEEVDDKARRWLAAGTEAVWVVYPRGKSVTVYEALDRIRAVTESQTLEGGQVVPGFQLPLSDLFAGLR